MLIMSRSLTFFPELASASRVVMHDPGIEGELESLKIHVSQHQNIPCAVFNHNRRHKAQGILFHTLPSEKSRTDSTYRYASAGQVFLKIHDTNFTEVKKACCQDRVCAPHSDSVIEIGKRPRPPRCNHGNRHCVGNQTCND